MFDIIKKFIADFDNSEEPEAFVHSNMELAEAVLMYHVTAVDGVVSEDEKRRLAEVLSNHFGLSPEETIDLIGSAKFAESEAVDLYKFTNRLTHSLEEDERIRIVENLWEMVFADGVVHELEDNVVWRIADLLGVSSRDRMELKQRVCRRNNKKVFSS